MSSGTPFPPSPPVIASSDLFKNGNEVFIRHEGVTYRLRITANNRLILTK